MLAEIGFELIRGGIPPVRYEAQELRPPQPLGEPNPGLQVELETYYIQRKKYRLKQQRCELCCPGLA